MPAATYKTKLYKIVLRIVENDWIISNPHVH